MLIAFHILNYAQWVLAGPIKRCSPPPRSRFRFPTRPTPSEHIYPPIEVKPRVVLFPPDAGRPRKITERARFEASVTIGTNPPPAFSDCATNTPAPSNLPAPSPPKP